MIGSAPGAPIVLVDMDEVLADLIGGLRRAARIPDLPHTAHILADCARSDTEREHVLDVLRQPGFALTLDPLPGAVDARLVIGTGVGVDHLAQQIDHRLLALAEPGEDAGFFLCRVGHGRLRLVRWRELSQAAAATIEDARASARPRARPGAVKSRRWREWLSENSA